MPSTRVRAHTDTHTDTHRHTHTHTHTHTRTFVLFEYGKHTRTFFQPKLSFETFPPGGPISCAIFALQLHS